MLRNSIFPDMGNKLRALRQEAGWTHEKAAEEMGVSKGQFIKLERGERRLTEQYIGMAAKTFGVRPADVIADDDEGVDIVGKVGAATNGQIIHDTDQGPFGRIQAPPGTRGGEVAVEVEGHSMGIYAPAGSLILYDDRHDPPTEDMLGQVCVVGLPDGRVLVKRLLRGTRKGLFDLESIVGDTLSDQRVEWAAVVAMVIHPRHAKRVRLDI